MAGRTYPIDEILSRLAEASLRLTSLTSGLTPAQLANRSGPGEWSANDVLAHLRACADVWGGCIGTILAEDHPAIRAIDPRTWIERTAYRELEFPASLRAFADQRRALLAELAPLAPDDWQRAATVTGSGRPLERTVHGFAQRLARHEGPHLRQIARLVAAHR